MDPWIKAQKQRRAALAKESLDIEIWATTDIVNTATRLRAQAYDEKLELRAKTKPDLSLTRKMEKLEAEIESRSLRATPARSETMAHSVSPVASSATLRSESASTSNETTRTASSGSSRRPAKARARKTAK